MKYTGVYLEYCSWRWRYKRESTGCL